MRNIQRFFVGFLAFLTALWLLAELPAWTPPPHFFAWRTLLMQYSGVLAMGVMSVAMVLAVRPVVFEPCLGGLNKRYRLHYWSGPPDRAGARMARCRCLLRLSVGR